MVLQIDFTRVTKWRNGLISIPTGLIFQPSRFIFKADTILVPDPQKGSRTTLSPFFDKFNSDIILGNKLLEKLSFRKYQRCTDSVGSALCVLRIFV